MARLLNISRSLFRQKLSNVFYAKLFNKVLLYFCREYHERKAVRKKKSKRHLKQVTIPFLSKAHGFTT
jgi:hypothetical protein